MVQPEVRLGRRFRLESEHPALHGETSVQVELVAVQPHGQVAAQTTDQVGGAPGMVQMTVGVEHHGRLEPTRGDAVTDPFGFLAWIDDRHHSGLLVAQENAVRLDRTYRKDIEEHITLHSGVFSS